MRCGMFFVQDGVLVPLSGKEASKIAKLEGQTFEVSLDDERPLNDRARAALFAYVRDWSASLPETFRKAFWKNWHNTHYAPVDDKAIIDMLKSMYGIKSIATARCGRQEFSDFHAWAVARLEEVSAAAQEMEREHGNEDM